MFEIPKHIYDAYKEPHRKYHNTDHIESILSKIPLFVEAYNVNEEEVELLTIIAWYHDVVYKPGSSWNEADSAQTLVDHFGYDMFSDPIQTILGTKYHTDPRSFLEAIFYDLDLADMGKDSYVENSYKIREEFGAFSDLEWLAGRQKFLDEFLSRPFIYHTSLGYSLWEAKARENMKLERAFLQGKYGS